MKAEHLQIDEHTKLYNSIYKEIRSTLDLNPNKANQYFIGKAIFYGLFTVSSYSLIFLIENPYLFALNFVVFGLLAVLLCFNFAHDLSHHALLKKPFWNNVFFEFIYTMVGAHPEAWKDRHLHSHHFAPNVKHFDTDLAISGIIRVIPDSDRKWFHKFQHLYAPLAYMTYSFYWVFIKDFYVVNHFKPKKKSQNLRYYFTFIFLKGCYLGYMLILPILFSKQPLWLILIAFLIMHMVQSLYTLFTFFITHHVENSVYPVANEEGKINTSWFMNQIKSSNDFYPYSFTANFIFGGVNNHIAHHLFPHINHYNYPKVNLILFKRLREAGIEPNVSTYFSGVRSHLKHLKNMGKPSIS
jgi:linoleoyl-CoA desaturase